MTVDARQDPNAHKELTLGKLINNAVFFDDDPPRWVLVASLFSLTLFDRSKWSGRRALHFDWSEILARNDLPTLKTHGRPPAPQQPLPGQRRFAP